MLSRRGKEAALRAVDADDLFGRSYRCEEGVTVELCADNDGVANVSIVPPLNMHRTAERPATGRILTNSNLACRWPSKKVISFTGVLTFTVRAFWYWYQAGFGARIDNMHRIFDGRGPAQYRQYIIASNAGTQYLASPSRKAPRTIHLDGDLASLGIRRNNNAINTGKVLECCSIPPDAPQIDQSWYTKKADKKHGYEQPAKCKLIQDWQLSTYPNCNDFHSMSYSFMRLINKGGERIAFEMKRYVDHNATNFVYKTIKSSREVNAETVEQQNNDALVLGRSSSSQFIPDIYGYCGVGILMPFMPEGNMHGT